MKLFLSVAAVLAWVIGVMLFVIPEKFYEPTGIALTPLLATIAQAHGATLIGLGVINWMARSADARGLVAVLTGNLLVQILSFLVVLRTAQLGAGMAVAPGAVIHIVLGSFFAFFLIRAQRLVPR